MANEPAPVRRLITGFDQDGKSIFSEDGTASFTTVPARPGFRHFHVWATGKLPVAADEPDRSGELSSILPLPGGSVLHILDIPPEPKDPLERQKAYGARRELARQHVLHPTPGVRHYPEGPHPGMHETDSIDYSIVLSGEIYAVLDKEERLLKAGDVLIQRGTSHAWANRSDQICRIAFMLVEATAPRR